MRHHTLIYIHTFDRARGPISVHVCLRGIVESTCLRADPIPPNINVLPFPREFARTKRDKSL